MVHQIKEHWAASYPEIFFISSLFCAETEEQEAKLRSNFLG